ncbi:3-deoxy-D-manno-octulosonic acid transferase [Thioclava atlantica]|uniref:3-deoxy-D-manno-octulosonic acid transferase n=1 Tax=Thioclava atlantica TaxID=1317124 RepID=A0A085TY04_9RHOB|nr:glycosyltransferase N-terminal domain-containing protein [Thioclava atlantica]KFE35601.1 3-deoxy-D-manno-octulosonic-acid transferase [Thioclava atlantica]
MAVRKREESLACPRPDPFYGAKPRSRPVFAYRLLVSLASLPVLIRLGWHVLRGRESARAVTERLGGGDAVPGALWLHAASNGEVTSAKPLIDALLARDPELRLLATVNTQTARALARSWGDARIAVRMAPLDHRLVLRRFLARHDPRALVVIENELWPNRMELMTRAGRPILVLGARISERSAARWGRTGLGRKMIGQITALGAQDAGSQARFLGLGLPHERLLPLTNLKTAIVPPTGAPLDWPRSDTILAASTHEGEEGPILDAFATARAHRPGLRLILAPRHPRRAPEIVARIGKAGLRHTSRSAEEAADAEVYLADTMGEMGRWYASAGICFVGGSLVEKGGHTPFEPAHFDCAILHGPHVANFRDAYAALDAQHGAKLCRDSADLAGTFATLGAREQAAMAEAARVALGPPADIEGLATAVLDRLRAR